MKIGKLQNRPLSNITRRTGRYVRLFRRASFVTATKLVEIDSTRFGSEEQCLLPQAG
jgi:hypothetical protein